MTKSEFISQVAHMAVERKVNKGRNITDFMNRYWPEDWVSVEDRLPEDRLFILLCTNSGYISTGFYNEADKVWSFGGGTICRRNSVTHWQLLPVAPSSNQ